MEASSVRWAPDGVNYLFQDFFNLVADLPEEAGLHRVRGPEVQVRPLRLLPPVPLPSVPLEGERELRSQRILTSLFP